MRYMQSSFFKMARSVSEGARHGSFGNRYVTSLRVYATVWPPRDYAAVDNRELLS